MDQLFNASNYLVKSTVKPILKQFNYTFDNFEPATQVNTVVLQETLPNMSVWMSVAGVMGASAVALGAYGAHVVYPKDISDRRKAQYETANKYHFLHSLAIIGVPFLKQPHISGSLFLTGTVLFSGSCYYMAIKEDQRVAKYTPIGGIVLMAAWLSLAAFS